MLGSASSRASKRTSQLSRGHPVEGARGDDQRRRLKRPRPDLQVDQARCARQPLGVEPVVVLGLRQLVGADDSEWAHAWRSRHLVGQVETVVQVVGHHHGLASRGRTATVDLEVGTRIRLAQDVQPRVPVRVQPRLELRGGLLEAPGGESLELGYARVRHRPRRWGVGPRLESPGQSGGCRRGLPDTGHQIGARCSPGEGRPEHRRPHGQRREQQHADRQQKTRPQATQDDRDQARPVARAARGPPLGVFAAYSAGQDPSRDNGGGQGRRGHGQPQG